MADATCRYADDIDPLRRLLAMYADRAFPADDLKPFLHGRKPCGTDPDEKLGKVRAVMETLADS